MHDFARRPYVIFDFDGTVADTKPTITYCATKALGEFGLTAEEIGDVTRLIGPPFPEAYEQVYGMSRDDAMRVTTRYREIWDDLGDAVAPLFPGMRELLVSLADSGKVLAIATSKAQRVIEAALESADITSVFAVVVGKPDDSPHTKVQAISGVLSALGAAADEAVMVGDRDLDIIGAKACGVASVGVTWGGTGDTLELSSAGADAIVDTMGELAGLLMCPD